MEISLITSSGTTLAKGRLPINLRESKVASKSCTTDVILKKIVLPRWRAFNILQKYTYKNMITRTIAMMSMVMIILGDVGGYHMMLDGMKMILDGIAWYLVVQGNSSKYPEVAKCT